MSSEADDVSQGDTAPARASNSPVAPREIQVTDLRDLRRDGAPHRVLDVREAWELEICRLGETLHVPMSEVPEKLAALPRDELLVVLCHHGMRSDRVTAWLRANGFPLATNLAGGIDAWARVVDAEVARY